MPIVPLDRAAHRQLTFASVEDYSFAAGINLVPLLAFEAVEAARCFPLVFPADRSPNPHALLGLGSDNLFVDGQGRWTAAYLPLTLANHPFSLIAPRSRQEETPEVILAFEEDAPHFRQSDGAPLYEPDGEPAEHLRLISSTLGAQYLLHKELEPSLYELHLSGVLSERPVTITVQGRVTAVNGLRTADRGLVMGLPDEVLARWARNGLLELLYAHWRSLRRLGPLLEALHAGGGGSGNRITAQ